jgi:hypothetical protein
VTERDLMGKFGKFIDSLVRKKQLSAIERVMIHSTFGAIPATHPFAQVHAFMGVHRLYAREYDVAASKKGRGLVDQPRFRQLWSAAMDWRNTNHPDVGRLAVEVVAEYAKTNPEKCLLTDLVELCKEVGGMTTVAPGLVKYFQKLESELAT